MTQSQNKFDDLLQREFLQQKHLRKMRNRYSPWRGTINTTTL